MVCNGFDIKIERVSMAENSPIVRQEDLEMYRDRGFQNRSVSDVLPNQDTSSTFGM